MHLIRIWPKFWRNELLKAYTIADVIARKTKQFDAWHWLVLRMNFKILNHIFIGLHLKRFLWSNLLCPRTSNFIFVPFKLHFCSDKSNVQKHHQKLWTTIYRHIKNYFTMLTVQFQKIPNAFHLSKSVSKEGLLIRNKRGTNSSLWNRNPKRALKLQTWTEIEPTLIDPTFLIAWISSFWCRTCLAGSAQITTSTLLRASNKLCSSSNEPCSRKKLY